MTGKEIIAFIQANKLQNKDLDFSFPILDINGNRLDPYQLKDCRMTNEINNAIQNALNKDRTDLETSGFKVENNSYSIDFIRYHKIREGFYVAKTREESRHRPRFYICIITIYSYCGESDGNWKIKYVYNKYNKEFEIWEK